MYIVSKIDYRYYYKYSKQILIICIILLIIILIPGIGTVRNGSRSWFGIGSFGIQPSEFTKLALIIFSSKYLCNHKKMLPIIIVTLFVFGLIMLQPDFGTGTIIVMTIFGILFINGMDISLIVKIGIIGIVGVVILILVAPYRLSRILSFLNPWSDPLGSGFQIIQSMYAIGPGGLFGLGFGNSIQKHFYLPEPQTDFIFSIISEEFGFVGILIVSSLFILVIYNSILISLSTKDKFAKNVSFGIIFGLSFQCLLNLMVVVGLIPVTGVTLPFLSYGGSSLLVSMASIGIILNISKNNN
jgi:cell division protein FtsW